MQHPPPHPRQLWAFWRTILQGVTLIVCMIFLISPSYGHEDISTFPEGQYGHPLSLKEAKEKFNKGLYIFDLRPQREWEAECIATSLYLNWEDQNALKTRLTEEVPTKNSPILLYSSLPEEEELNYAAYLLSIEGYTNIYILNAPFSAWVKASYPVE